MKREILIVFFFHLYILYIYDNNKKRLMEDDEFCDEYHSEEFMRWKISVERRLVNQTHSSKEDNIDSMMNLEAFATMTTPEERKNDEFETDTIVRICGIGMEKVVDEHVGDIVLGRSSSGGQINVYANRRFKKGDTVEVCAYVASDSAMETERVWKVGPDLYVLLLGFGSLYRRSSNKGYINVNWSWKDRGAVLRDDGDESNSKQYVEVRAVRDIERGEALILEL